MVVAVAIVMVAAKPKLEEAAVGMVATILGLQFISSPFTCLLQQL